jgi:prolyl-tRNA synthetase
MLFRLLKNVKRWVSKAIDKIGVKNMDWPA